MKWDEQPGIDSMKELRISKHSGILWNMLVLGQTNMLWFTHRYPQNPLVNHSFPSAEQFRVYLLSNEKSGHGPAAFQLCWLVGSCKRETSEISKLLEPANSSWLIRKRGFFYLGWGFLLQVAKLITTLTKHTAWFANSKVDTCLKPAQFLGQ